MAKPPTHVDEEPDSFNIVFDVDAYIEDEEAVEHCVMNSNEWFNLMNVEMQDRMFELFKDVVTIGYLDSCKDKKELE